MQRRPGCADPSTLLRGVPAAKNPRRFRGIDPPLACPRLARDGPPSRHTPPRDPPAQVCRSPRDRVNPSRGRDAFGRWPPPSTSLSPHVPQVNARERRHGALLAGRAVREYNRVGVCGVHGGALVVPYNTVQQPALFPEPITTSSIEEPGGQVTGRDARLWRAYRFLRERAQDGFTAAELARAADWKPSAVRTYLSKKWRGYIQRRANRLFFAGVEQMSWEQFRELHSQVDPSARSPDWYGLRQERADLDFVGPMNWEHADRKAKFGVLKTVLGMSNIPSGGRIVVGVTECEGRFEFVGLTEEQVASFEQTKVVSFLAANAEASLRVSIDQVAVQGNDTLS